MCALVFAVAGCAPARPVAEPQVAPGAYRIAAGDTLDIVVWGEDKVSGTVQVRPDGMVSVALVGDLPAAGQTPEELADRTRDALARYIDAPNVVVRVAATGSRHFFVMGNVRAPGMYDLRAGQTMIQALAVAGGFTEFANESRVKILRPGAAPIERDYGAVVQGKVSDVLLEPNDTIVVP
jgi:polysaccharide export outer membrane protein